MSRASWDRRLRAIEARPSVQKPLVITGGLPSGEEMIAALARASAQSPEPLCPRLSDPGNDPGSEAPATESIRAKATEPTDHR
jgi:hypothetical protein